jgi:hypothetical protein
MVPEKLSDCLARVGTPEGKRRLDEYLASLPFPHYEPAEDGMFVRISEEGERTLGRFIGREFVPHVSDKR